MDRFEKLLSLKFNTTEAEDINGATLLGMQVTYDKELGKLTIGHEPSVDKYLEMFGMTNCNPARTPYTGLVLDKTNSAPQDEEEKASMQRFRETVGSQVGAQQYLAP